MIQINHQLLQDRLYYPNWKIKYLFIGTFNPEGGEKVNYFYGRNGNRVWELLSEIFSDRIDTNDPLFFEILEQKGIACMDMINSIEISEKTLEYVIGSGYKDSNIINSKVKLIYNTDSILKIIRNNPKVKVYSTWGKGSNNKEWQREVAKIPNIVNLVSPSMAARVPKGVKKYDYIRNNWRNNIVPLN